MEHTPTPWRQNGPDVMYQDRTVCSCGYWPGEPLEGEEELCAEHEANAARITACVNACEGIKPEAVPELLAACKWARAAINGSYGHVMAQATADTCIRRLRDAIAKARKEGQ